MSNNAYFLHASNSAKRIAETFKNRTPIQRSVSIPPQPVFENNLVSLINIEKNVQSNDGPSKIIDVQPDFRNIVTVLNYHITRLYSGLD